MHSINVITSNPSWVFVKKTHNPIFPNFNNTHFVNFASRVTPNPNPNFKIRTFYKNQKHGFCRGVKLTSGVLTEEDEDEMSDGFFEAIEELERMTRDPSDVLEEMNSRLSARELQLVLVYFSQEGRDSWCALEVFEWLKKENKVDDETMELMVSLMCGWVRKMIEGGNEIEDVIGVIVDMECVGLKPGFSMIEKVISLYWEMGEREKGAVFVKEVLRRGVGGGESGRKGGPTGYLAWKMMLRAPSERRIYFDLMQ